jgi:chorismate dehydratase
VPLWLDRLSSDTLLGGAGFSPPARDSKFGALIPEESLPAPIVTKLRISIVQYLNTAPLVRGFTHGPLQGKYDLSFTVPSQCAKELRTGAAEVAIIPAIEYQRIDALTILPNLSIASKGRVRSLLLVSKVPIRQARSIALDSSSRSTQALTKILCAEHWKISPTLREASPDLSAMLQDTDAALLIGDPALRLSLVIESEARRGPDAEQICPSASAGIACAGATNLHIYDIVEEWRRLTNLPAVLAIWAVRQDAVPPSALPEIVSDFQSSLTFGLDHLAEIAREASATLNLPEPDLRAYLQQNIDYTLDPENLQGLQHFFTLSSAAKITGPLKPIALADNPGTLTAGISNSS